VPSAPNIEPGLPFGNSPTAPIAMFWTAMSSIMGTSSPLFQCMKSTTTSSAYWAQEAISLHSPMKNGTLPVQRLVPNDCHSTCICTDLPDDGLIVHSETKGSPVGERSPARSRSANMRPSREVPPGAMRRNECGLRNHIGLRVLPRRVSRRASSKLRRHGRLYAARRMSLPLRRAAKKTQARVSRGTNLHANSQHPVKPVGWSKASQMDSMCDALIQVA